MPDSSVGPITGPCAHRLAMLSLLLVAACGPTDQRQTGPRQGAAQSARVCDGASDGASDQAKCVDVTGPDEMAELEAAFTAGPAGNDCSGTPQKVYRIVLVAGTDNHTVDVLAACASTLTEPGSEVTDGERKLVEQGSSLRHW